MTTKSKNKETAEPKIERTYSVIRYTDAVQNDQEYWIIQSMEQSNVFLRTKDAKSLSAKEILQFLKKHKIIDSADLRKVNATVGLDLIEVHEKKSLKPLCRLQKYTGLIKESDVESI